MAINHLDDRCNNWTYDNFLFWMQGFLYLLPKSFQINADLYTPMQFSLNITLSIAQYIAWYGILHQDTEGRK